MESTQRTSETRYGLNLETMRFTQAGRPGRIWLALKA